MDIAQLPIGRREAYRGKMVEVDIDGDHLSLQVISHIDCDECGGNFVGMEDLGPWVEGEDLTRKYYYCLSCKTLLGGSA